MGMKRKKIIIAALVLVVIAALLSVLILCSAEEDDIVVLIEAGVTEWKYRTMTVWDFTDMPSDWIQGSAFVKDWDSKVSPFGDRIDPYNGSGWAAENHVLLLVTTFDIKDLNKAREKEFIANIFYDNTMTVYLNGAEIFYDVGWVDGYIDLPLNLKDYLKSGSNTLAISLEDDAGGREFDMSLIMRTPSAEQPPNDPPPSVSENQLSETGLSTVYINTSDGDYVTSRISYKDAAMRIELSNSYSKYSNVFTKEGAAIKIKGRGNSTWNNGYPDGKLNTLPGDTHTRKVPYTIKLFQKADLFGMGKSKKWVLISNYMDRTMMRNKLIYDLSGQMGMVFCKSVYVNLVLNGEYMGTYALTQKVDTDLFDGEVTDWEDIAEDFAAGVAEKYGFDENRQSELEDRLCADMSWLTSGKFEGYNLSDYVDTSTYSIYTGYLIEYDGYSDEDSFFYTNNNVPLKVSNMEAIKTNPALFEYIVGFFNDFEEACLGDNFTNSKGKHYTEYVDINSLVDCYILNTVILNVEFGYKSMYMYINSDNKIVFGPCWDYDWSSGNPFLGASGDYFMWYNDWRAQNNKWYRELYGDPYFVSLVKERWSQLSGALDDMVNSIDYYYDMLYKASVLEYDKFSKDPYETDFAGRTGGRSFKDECNQLKTFLKNRIYWLDQQFSFRDPDIENFGMHTNGTLSLSLSGNVAAKNKLADYTLALPFSSFTISVTSDYDCKAQIWLNGACRDKINLSANTAKTLNASGSELTNGVNVITVYLYQGDYIYDINYISVYKDGEKRPSPTLGSYISGYEDDNSNIPDPPPQQGGDTPVKPPEVTTKKPNETTVKPPEITTKKPQEQTTPKPTQTTLPQAPTVTTEPETTSPPSTKPEGPVTPVTDGKKTTSITTQKTQGGSQSTAPIIPGDSSSESSNDDSSKGQSFIIPAFIAGGVVVALTVLCIVYFAVVRKKKR